LNIGKECKDGIEELMRGLYEYSIVYVRNRKGLIKANLEKKTVELIKSFIVYSRKCEDNWFFDSFVS